MVLIIIMWEGYLVNNNSYHAFHVKVDAIEPNYAKGNVIATNNTGYLYTSSISLQRSFTYFYVRFQIPITKW